MKNFIFTLLIVLMTITAASQTLPVVGVQHSQRQRSLQVVNTQLTRQMRQSAVKKRNQQPKLNARLISSQQVSEGVVENLYQCSIDGEWDKFMSQYAPTWTTYVTFDENAGTATFTNLAGFDGGYVTPCNVTAPMANGVVTIPCSAYDGSEGSTLLGDFWGTPVYLYAGDYDSSSGEILADDELKLTIGENYSTLRTDDKAMAIVYTYNNDLTALCYVSKPKYDLANESASSTISTEVLDFGKTTPNTTKSAVFSLTSTGTKDVEYSIAIDNEAFFLNDESEGTLSALTTCDFTILFAPAAAGEYNGTATITTAEATHRIALSGRCVEVPTDFSPIFTAGDAALFTWDNTSDFPWSINENNQAVPGNLGQAPEYDEEEADAAYERGEDYDPQLYSILKASYNSDKALRLTFDMYLQDDAGDSLGIEVDGYRILKYSCTNKSYTHSCVIPKGQHTLTFSFNTGSWAERDANVTLGNVRLEEVDTWADVVRLNKDAEFSSYDLINIAGKAYSKSDDACFAAEITAENDSYFSFEYAEGVQDISVSTYDYLTDGYQEFTADGSGKLGVTVKAGFCGMVSVIIPEGQYISDVCVGEGPWESTRRTYQMVGTSYYSQNGAFLTDGGYKFSYPCDVTLFADGSVWFDGLFMPNDSYYPYHNVIKGRVSDDGKIHISAKRDFNEGTLYGWNDDTYGFGYVGDRFWLIAGPVVNNEPQFKDELIISMSNDKMMLTADDAFGVWVTFNFYDETTSFEYWMPGTRFLAATDSYSLLPNPDSLDFGTSYPDVKITRSVTISNNGKDNNIRVAIEGEQAADFSVADIQGELASMASIEMVVSFQGHNAGEYKADLMVYNDGETLIVPLHAEVKASSDYSAIVDEGAELITWSAGSAYPWTIEGNTAYSSNKGIMSSHSSIVASVDVPEGSVGTIAFQAASYPEPGYDSFRFYDGDSLFTYSLMRNDSIVYQHVLAAGHHDLEFGFYKDNIDEVYFEGDFASLKHVCLNISPANDDDAHLFIPEASFTELVPVGETWYGNAYIVNTGRNTLTLSSVEGDDHFGARLTSPMSCAPGDTLHVYTSFHAAEAGVYSGNVLFHTTAGVLSLPLQAKADYVYYLSDKDSYAYSSPYPTAWTAIGYDNVNVQSIYHEDMTSELAGRDLLSMTYFSYVIADAPLTCEDVEYQIGSVSKPAVYDKEATGLKTVYHGAQPEVVNYEMTIPFDEPYHFEGGHLEVQLLLRAAESFRVQFPFLCSDMSAEYPQCTGITDKVGLAVNSYLPYIRFQYAQTATGLDGIEYDGQKQIKDISVYDTLGHQRNTIQRGINIIVTTYSDGTTSSVRQYVR